MNPNFHLEGVFSAQWLPLDASGGIDRGALAAHMEFERGCGIHGLLALGSTAGFPFLSPPERLNALAAVAECAGPLARIANVSDIRPKVAVELGLAAKDLGYGAIALMPPMFFPVSHEDMLAYFLHVADAVGLPVVLYNFPELTGKRIEIETVAAFADRAPLAGIKQSGGDFDYHRPLLRLAKEKNFVVATGSDLRLPEAFALGAGACIGGLVNIVPELMVRLFNARGAAPDGESTAAFERMREIGTVIDTITFPLNVAAGIEARGLQPGATKAVVSSATAKTYQKIVSTLRARFAEWGLAPALVPSTIESDAAASTTTPVHRRRTA